MGTLSLKELFAWETLGKFACNNVGVAVFDSSFDSGCFSAPSGSTDLTLINSDQKGFLTEVRNWNQILLLATEDGMTRSSSHWVRSSRFVFVFVRVCPGKALAETLLNIMIATILHVANISMLGDEPLADIIENHDFSPGAVA